MPLLCAVCFVGDAEATSPPPENEVPEAVAPTEAKDATRAVAEERINADGKEIVPWSAHPVFFQTAKLIQL